MIRFFTPERRKSAGYWLAELGIVVAGVLIALYAQQWDSDRQAKKRGAAAVELIRSEILKNSKVQMERIALHACQRDRLATIATKIARGDTEWADFAYPPDPTRLTTIRRIYRPVLRNFGKDAFEGAVASGTLDVMEPERQISLGNIYRQYAHADAMQREEYALATRLDSLTVGGPIEPPEKRQLLGTIALLDRSNGLSTTLAMQNLSTLRDLGMYPTDKQLRAWKKSVAEEDVSTGLINFARARYLRRLRRSHRLRLRETSSFAKIHSVTGDRRKIVSTIAAGGRQR